MTKNFIVIFFFIGFISLESIAQDKIRKNYFSPVGNWKIKEPLDNSPGQINLYVPDFITSCDPDLLTRTYGYNSVLWSRKNMYKDLFMELLIQSTAEENALAAILTQSISSIIKHENFGIKVLGEMKIISKSSLFYKEFPYQLQLVSILFTVDYKVGEAEIEAAALYSSLSAFTETRYKYLQTALLNSGYNDPEMIQGLNDAYGSIIKIKEKDRDNFITEMKRNTGTEEATSGLVKMAIGGLFGKCVSAIAGAGLVSASLSTLLPTAWFWQLGRTYNYDQAEASIVLLSTIDRALLEKTSVGSSPADNYILMQLRTHLSYMINEAAVKYYKSASATYRDRLPIETWIKGYPYYDKTDLTILKQKAKSELEIIWPQGNQNKEITDPQNSGNFTDIRDGKIYKWIKIGDQIWMAENLAYRLDDGGWAYDNNIKFVLSYGYLYGYYNALMACPAGWHLSSNEEWEQLESYLGIPDPELKIYGERGEGIGSKLKSINGWIKNGNGNNSSGFNALPGGGISDTLLYMEGSTDDEPYSVPNINPITENGNWWTSSTDEFSLAIFRNLDWRSTKVEKLNNYLSAKFSVRCINNKNYIDDTIKLKYYDETISFVRNHPLTSIEKYKMTFTEPFDAYYIDDVAGTLRCEGVSSNGTFQLGKVIINGKSCIEKYRISEHRIVYVIPDWGYIVLDDTGGTNGMSDYIYPFFTITFNSHGDILTGGGEKLKVNNMNLPGLSETKKVRVNITDIYNSPLKNITVFLFAGNQVYNKTTDNFGEVVFDASPKNILRIAVADLTGTNRYGIMARKGYTEMLSNLRLKLSRYPASSSESATMLDDLVSIVFDAPDILETIAKINEALSTGIPIPSPGPSLGAPGVFSVAPTIRDGKAGFLLDGLLVKYLKIDLNCKSTRYGVNYCSENENVY